MPISTFFAIWNQWISTNLIKCTHKFIDLQSFCMGGVCELIDWTRPDGRFPHSKWIYGIEKVVSSLFQVVFSGAWWKLYLIFCSRLNSHWNWQWHQPWWGWWWWWWLWQIYWMGAINCKKWTNSGLLKCKCSTLIWLLRQFNFEIKLREGNLSWVFFPHFLENCLRGNEKKSIIWCSFVGF